MNYTIEQDEDAGNPRTEYDNAATMVCWHRRYTLGDKHDFKSPADFEAWWKENGKGGISLPLYLYDHSGLTMNTTGFSCPWDSGRSRQRIGFLLGFLRPRVLRGTSQSRAQILL